MLGKREIPILSVLTVSGFTDKSKEQILHDTQKLTSNHLRGGYWSDNAKCLELCRALIEVSEQDLDLSP